MKNTVIILVINQYGKKIKVYLFFFIGDALIIIKRLQGFFRSLSNINSHKLCLAEVKSVLPDKSCHYCQIGQNSILCPENKYEKNHVKIVTLVKSNVAK